MQKNVAEDTEIQIPQATQMLSKAKIVAKDTEIRRISR